MEGMSQDNTSLKLIDKRQVDEETELLEGNLTIIKEVTFHTSTTAMLICLGTMILGLDSVSITFGLLGLNDCPPETCNRALSEQLDNFAISSVSLGLTSGALGFICYLVLCLNDSNANFAKVLLSTWSIVKSINLSLVLSTLLENTMYRLIACNTAVGVGIIEFFIVLFLMLSGLSRPSPNYQ